MTCKNLLRWLLSAVQLNLFPVSTSSGFCAPPRKLCPRKCRLQARKRSGRRQRQKSSTTMANRKRARARPDSRSASIRCSVRSEEIVTLKNRIIVQKFQRTIVKRTERIFRRIEQILVILTLNHSVIFIKKYSTFYKETVNFVDRLKRTNFSQKKVLRMLFITLTPLIIST